MRLIRVLSAVGFALLLVAAALAQTPNSGFHSVACFKVKPDRMAEFHKFAAEEMHKVAQGRIGDGEITAFYLLRSVAPQGQAADCDYVVVTIFPGLPHMFGPEHLAAAIRKAGASFTPEDYMAHRNAVAQIVTVSIFQNLAAVGKPKQGDYFQVNYMKVTDDNFDDWIAYEKKVWKPLAEALVKDGKESGWSLNVQRMPTGSETPYQAVTVDIFPTMDAVFDDDPKFAERFHSVHPDRELGTTFQQFERLRVRAQVRLFLLEDYVSSN